MKISRGIVPSLDSVQQATLAEELGDDRAWLYDSPAIDADIWVTMARVAEHTDRITDLDRILVDAAGEGIVGMGWVAEPDGIRQKIAEAEAMGTTEIIYAPSGPDLARELRIFAEVAGL